MLTLNSQINISTSYPLQYPYNWEDVIFFDIETTGLSAKTSYLYLIGCMYYYDNTWQITQWFADDIASERQIIKEFVDKIKNYKKIIHYNGTGFDIPFILQKCKLYQIPDPFDVIESYDIYKNILPFKKLLPIANLKLKTVEDFVGIKREDTKSGEELIKIYSSYLGRNQYEKIHQKRIATPVVKSNQNDKENELFDNTGINKSSEPTSDDLLSMLLLHNKEDVQGLLPVSNILYYKDIFQLSSIMKLLKENTYLDRYKLESNLSFRKNMFQEDIDNSNTMNKTDDLKCFPINVTRNINYYTFAITLPFQIIKPITWSVPLLDKNMKSTFNRNTNIEENSTYNNNTSLSVDKNLLVMKIPIYTGELKFFFENYKEYYYLPKEDIAIHKSVAEYVDKEYRMKAKPDTCYNRLTSSFLPQNKDIFAPSFKLNYKDKQSFFEINPILNQVDSSLDLNEPQREETSNPLNPVNSKQMKTSCSSNTSNQDLDKQDKLLEYITDWIHFYLNCKEIKIIS